MDWIKRNLRKEGIRQSELLNEMVDHYLTVYEDFLENNLDDKTAKKQTIQQIQDLNAKQLNKDIFYIHHQSKIYFAMITILNQPHNFI